MFTLLDKFWKSFFGNFYNVGCSLSRWNKGVDDGREQMRLPQRFLSFISLRISTQGNAHPQSTSRGVLVYTLNVSIQFLLRISTPILQRSHLELMLVKINHTTGRDWSCWRRDSVIHVDVCSWDAPQCTERYKVKSSLQIINIVREKWDETWTLTWHGHRAPLRCRGLVLLA